LINLKDKHTMDKILLEKNFIDTLNDIDARLRKIETKFSFFQGVFYIITALLSFLSGKIFL